MCYHYCSKPPYIVHMNPQKGVSRPPYLTIEWHEIAFAFQLYITDCYVLEYLKSRQAKSLTAPLWPVS